MCRSVVLLCLLLPDFAVGGEKITSPTPLLTAQELAEGWLLLFDGETPYGWTSDQEEGKVRRPIELQLDASALVVGSLKNKGAMRAYAPACFDSFELKLSYRVETKGEVNAKLLIHRGTLTASSHDFGRTDNSLDKWGELHLIITYDPAKKKHHFQESNQARGNPTSTQGATENVSGSPALRLEAGLGTRLLVRNVKLRPLKTKKLFNGKDLAGWREFPGKKSTFAVNAKEELNIKDGPGDLQTQGQYGDLVLQLECISHGKHLNSGVFFRCRPGEYQQGYEAQIRNEFTKEEREYKLDDYFEGKLLGKKIVLSRAIDHGTGGIQYRMPARKAMAKDGEWFAMTIVAHGKHLGTWVNGVQVADWTDHRPLADNARKGCRLEPGPISLQGHDPTTNLSFRNLRIAEIVGAHKNE